MDIDKIIDIVRTLKEEGEIANAVGAPPGNIAGLHGDPPVRRKKKYIYVKGVRKNWVV
jgi:uncharacterized protein YdbL (DUF1318 family)